MLERFHVSEEEAVRIAEPKMRAATEAVFAKMGLSDDDSRLSADVLLYADIRGVDTHGVSNMLRIYVAGYQNGTLNPHPNMRTLRDSGAVITFDGDKGLGLHTAPKAMEAVIEKAKTYGVASGTLMNAGHLGAAGYHAMMATQHDMIGVCFTGGGGFAMLPTFGAEPRFGTNPISWAAPARKQPPFLFDAATTQVAGNKIRLLQRMGRPIAPGWLAGADGAPIMEEAPVPKHDLRGEERHWYMLPMGGDRENSSHKGYGIASIVDIMCCSLAGFGPGFISGKSGHFFMAFNIEAFTDKEKFKDDMDAFLGGLAATKPAPGHERVLFPGLPEDETMKDRLARGIPYHPEVIEWFETISAELELGLDLR